MAHSFGATVGSLNCTWPSLFSQSQFNARTVCVPGQAGLSWQRLLAPLHHNIRDHARLKGGHTISHVLAERAIFGPCLSTVLFLISADELRDLQLDSCRFPLH